MRLGLPTEGLVDHLHAPARKDFLKDCQSTLKGNWPAIGSHVNYSFLKKSSTFKAPKEMDKQDTLEYLHHEPECFTVTPKSLNLS